MMFALSLRLASLTIAQGDYYRDLSDNKRLKEVYVTAPRGEIRDRNGRLLAGNKPSFTVQLLKDELNLYNLEEKNDIFLKLIRILEEDGTDYLDEFPIELNSFKYRNEKDYNTESLSPMDKVVQIIMDNNIQNKILTSYYIYEGYDDHYQFIVANRAIQLLKNKGIDIPIDVSLDSGQINFFFKENVDIETWKKDNNIAKEDSPLQVLNGLINEDKTIIRNIIDHSLSKKIVYDILKSMNLLDNIVLEEYSITYMDEYLDQKRNLSQIYPKVTMESKAIDDFVNIFIDTSLKNFLKESFKVQDKREKIFVPGEILISMIEEKGINLPIEIHLDEENGIQYKYTDNAEMIEDDIIDLLIEQAKEASILKKFITRDDIKSKAQEQLLKDGVNPKISVSKDIEYVAINNLKNFYTGHKIEEGSSVEEAFNKLKEKYKIDEELSKYESRTMFILHDQLKKQGYLAYQPINFAYGIKESTVAKIEEGLMDVSGIDVSIEPIRYYPEGTTAAHILGYLGKISQPNEIKKYVEEKKYSPSAIIGKTGIEESFEEKLSGKNGIKKVEVDSVGNTTKTIDEEKPIPGDNIYLSIDLNVQKTAEKALEQTLKELRRGGTYKSQWGDFQFGTNRKKGRPYKNATSGALVAVDVKTGQVIASASYPAYDPNLFSTGISNSDWISLFPEDENDMLAPRPLYNIVTQTAIQPGSIFKMLTALTALEKGLSPYQKIRDMGSVDVGNSHMDCLIWSTSRRTHGYVDVHEALRDSCNYYFYSLAFGKNQKTGEHLGVKVEVEDLVDMSKKFGLDDKTGIEINVPAEVAGGVPDPQKKISGSKNMLRSYLNREIDKYFEEGFEYEEEDKAEIIEEIVSWSDYDTPLSYGEVMKRLRELHVDPEKRLLDEKGNMEKESIADKIKFTYLNYAGWNISDTLNITIGQGLNAYTPIQMANYVAAIANGGYRHKLTVIDNIKNYNNSKTNYTHEPKPEKIKLNNYTNLDHIMEGMAMVSEDGAYKRIFQNLPVKVGSKTGTAERSGINPSTGDTYDDFAWFVGFAPYDDPQIAVAAVIFQGGSGGYAGPMVRDVIAEYLGLNKTETTENMPLENSLSR